MRHRRSSPPSAGNGSRPTSTRASSGLSRSSRRDPPERSSRRSCADEHHRPDRPRAIETSALGRTYLHEHIFVLSTDVQQNYPDEWGDEETRVADAVQKLSALAAQGVRNIVLPL